MKINHKKILKSREKKNKKSTTIFTIHKQGSTVGSSTLNLNF